MEIRLFNKDKDFKKLCELIKKHKMEPLYYEEMPILGVVVENKRKLVAMGFLRQCEGCLGILDSIITDPEIESQHRDEALNIIFKEIIALAKKMNIYSLIGFTIDDNVISRSMKYGFRERSHKIMALQIEG